MKIPTNKNTIIAIAAIVVVCGGSLLGVKALSNSVPEPQSTVQITTTAPTAVATEPTTTEPTTTETTTLPTTQPTTVTTTQPTTLPIQNAVTTTAPTTQPTTLPTTQPTTAKPVTSQQAQSVINNAALLDEGFLSYQYSPDGNYYYTNSDPWQRALGYTEMYDVAAPFVAIYFDTIRCKFQYDNKDWMIQFWKGQYGYVFIGAEIGVYNKPLDRGNEFYDCATDEEALYMSMTTYRDGEEIFTRDYGKYWWCTGFVPGKLDSFSDRSELMVKSRITMKDYKMLLAFTGALKENGYNLGDEFTTSGLDVFFTWQ